MKPYRIAICAWLGLVAAAFPLHASAFENEPKGFRGLDWDTPIESVQKQLILIAGEGKETYYLRASDKLEIGDARLRDIVYRFYDGRFFGVVIRPARGNRDSFIEAFHALYGTGRKTNSDEVEYVWAGDDSEIILFCQDLVDECYAVVRSTEVARRENAEENKQTGAAN